MAKHEAEFIDFPVSVALRNVLDALPKAEDSTDDETPPVFRFVLNKAYSGEIRGIEIEPVGGTYSSHSYTIDSKELGGTQRFYTILRALFEAKT